MPQVQRRKIRRIHSNPRPSTQSPFCKCRPPTIAGMTDAAKKKEAMMHLEMSKAEMKKGNEAGCMAHMEEAHKAMGL